MARLIDQAAKRYGTRPSQMVQIQDPALALEFDVALADRCRQEQWIEVQTQCDEDQEPDWFKAMLLYVMQLI